MSGIRGLSEIFTKYMKHTYDVIVVGAGPAGSMAALHAAKGGASVLLLEKDRDVGCPVRCAEGVGIESMKGVVDIRPEWIANRIDRFRIIAPNGISGEPDIDKVDPDIGGRGYILNRKVFDYDLAMMAVEAGADLHTKAYVHGLVTSNGSVEGVRVRLLHREHQIKAEIIIGADGVESRVGKWAGIDTTTNFEFMASAAQMTLANINVEPDLCEFYVGSKVAPGGYFWIFPKSSHEANVGCAVDPKRSKTKKAIEFVREFVAERFPNASIMSTVAGGIPGEPTLDTIVKDNVLLVGDAAHQANPFNGGGIASGMKAGIIAGEVAATAIKTGSLKVLNSYPKRWNKLLGRKHRMLYRLASTIYSLSDETYNKVGDILADLPPEKLTLRHLIQAVLLQHPSLLKDLFIFGRF